MILTKNISLDLYNQCSSSHLRLIAGRLHEIVVGNHEMC